MVINPVYEAIFDYADRVGVRNIKWVPGVWSHNINDEWRVAINPKRYALDTSKDDGENGAYIHSMCCAIWRHGKLVADVSILDCSYIDQSFNQDEFMRVISELP